uniref:Uncharacterized protein n=1 Tax=Graphocephala atropunctata TaxID=36148 RepID=A0A1B6MMS6_9HEMI
MDKRHKPLALKLNYLLTQLVPSVMMEINSSLQRQHIKEMFNKQPTSPAQPNQIMDKMHKALALKPNFLLALLVPLVKMKVNISLQHHHIKEMFNKQPTSLAQPN